MELRRRKEPQPSGSNPLELASETELGVIRNHGGHFHVHLDTVTFDFAKAGQISNIFLATISLSGILVMLMGQ